MGGIALALAGLVVVPVQAAEPIPSPGLLARYVPVDARLFLEIRDTQSLYRTHAGAAIGDLLATLMTQMNVPGTAPAGEQDWRQMFARAVGLAGQERIVDLLLDGPVAVAAGSWYELNAAVLIVSPTNPAALESALETRKLPAEDNPPIRRYRLEQDHELACDGRIAIVGRGGRAESLYDRTLVLLRSAHGVALADLAEFRERIADVPAGAQVALYFGANLRRSEDTSPPTTWWQQIGVPVRSAALGVTLDEQGVSIETVGRTEGSAPVAPTRDVPVDALLFLPSSTVFAWTYPLDYAGEFRRLKQTYSQSGIGFYLSLLQWGMAAGNLESGLLDRLVGDSVFLVARVPVQPLAEDNQGEPPLLMPTFALAVETDDPDAVDATLQQVATNLLRLVNLQPALRRQVAVEAETPDGGQCTIRTVPLTPLLDGGSAREFLGSLELSWTLVDRWLVMATHRETVREIVLARQGEAPLMPADAVQEAVHRDRPPRRMPDMVLVAQPEAAAEIIDSWLAYIGRHHPEMLEPQWWKQLRRRYWASRIQLGILPVVDPASGAVEVSQTMTNWPAHGRLEAGDRIIAADGVKLDPAQSLTGLRERLIVRPHDDRMVLTVLRGGEQRDIEIPLGADVSPAAHVQPFTLLKQISTLARTFAFASYTAWRPARDLLHTRLELRINTATATAPALTTVGEPTRN